MDEYRWHCDLYADSHAQIERFAQARMDNVGVIQGSATVGRAGRDGPGRWLLHMEVNSREAVEQVRQIAADHQAPCDVTPIPHPVLGFLWEVGAEHWQDIQRTGIAARAVAARVLDLAVRDLQAAPRDSRVPHGENEPRSMGELRIEDTADVQAVAVVYLATPAAMCRRAAQLGYDAHVQAGIDTAIGLPLRGSLYQEHIHRRRAMVWPEQAARDTEAIVEALWPLITATAPAVPTAPETLPGDQLDDLIASAGGLGGDLPAIWRPTRTPAPIPEA